MYSNAARLFVVEVGFFWGPYLSGTQQYYKITLSFSWTCLEWRLLLYFASLYWLGWQSVHKTSYALMWLDVRKLHFTICNFFFGCLGEHKKMLRPPWGIWEPHLHQSYKHCVTGAIPSKTMVMYGDGVLKLAPGGKCGSTTMHFHIYIYK